jgi:RND family efflux transporter MFP subunit
MNSDTNSPSSSDSVERSLVEQKLRAEIEDLRRRLDQSHSTGGAHSAAHGAHGPKRKVSARTLIVLTVLALAGFTVAFFAGFLPLSGRETALAKEAKDSETAVARVIVVPVTRSQERSELVLPGNIEAVTEAPILARASGYIKKRYVDIGDKVKEGQLLAEIDAAELDQQVHQAEAAKEQASSALEQANANLDQGNTNAELAKITNDRYTSLIGKGAVSKQDADTYKAQYEAQRSSVVALQKAVNAAKSNIAVAEANLSRLAELQSYLKVRAPFNGVITLRNVDTGALVNEANTLMFRIAQTDRLRIYVNVPQVDAPGITVGQSADVSIPDLRSKKFKGTVTRTANALDPSSRTLLAEVQLDNASGVLFPGMYAQVDFITSRAEPPLLIRGDTLVTRADGPQVAVVDANNLVHYHKLQLGRDFGDNVEVLAGLEAGERIVVNPGDSVREKGKVDPVLLKTSR